MSFISSLHMDQYIELDSLPCPTIPQMLATKPLDGLFAPAAGDGRGMVVCRPTRMPITFAELSTVIPGLQRLLPG
jgi:hypothetical protein